MAATPMTYSIPVSWPPMSDIFVAGALQRFGASGPVEHLVPSRFTSISVPSTFSLVPRDLSSVSGPDEWMRIVESVDAPW